MEGGVCEDGNSALSKSSSGARSNVLPEASLGIKISLSLKEMPLRISMYIFFVHTHSLHLSLQFSIYIFLIYS